MDTRFLSLLVLILSLSASLHGRDKTSKLIQEDGALYVESLLEKPIKLKVLKSAHAYGTLKGERYLGTLKPGQEVTLLAISARAYRVRGKAQQGDIAGWAGPTFFKKLDPEFVSNLKKAAERKALVDDLIANKEVALGMTGEEVLASLGKPTKRASELNTEGTTETLDYITYERVPQTSYVRNGFGQVVKKTTYVKVETGRLSVKLQDDIVASISESESNESRRDLGLTIPVPILIH
ncbi:hypothetical protein N8586_03780 [Verrucomicrobiales bacterium]|nr:hypothetical protein [Verrucomicrobiales bacterium]